MPDWVVLRYIASSGWLPVTPDVAAGRERYACPVERALARQGLPVFFPQVKRRAFRRRARCWRVGPLFPGYGFVSAACEWGRALREPGVIGHIPDVFVRDSEMAKIRARMTAAGYVDADEDNPLDRFALAQRVRVGTGSLSDLIGKYAGLVKHKPGQALVNFELLGRVVPTEVSEGELVAA